MPTTINRIYFMFHPTCWSQGVDANGQPPETVANKDAYIRCYEWEKKVLERAKAFFKQMKPDDMLVLFPIGSSPAMQDLEKAADAALGERCIIPTPTPINADSNWTIDMFLDGPDLPGREDVLREVPPDIRAELDAEMRAARDKIGNKWNMGVIKVVVYNRLCAAETLQVMAERGLVFDPETVECEAFGEGFEQCAMTWKSMMVPYLGIKHPAPNIFDLSVTGAQFLVNAELKERIALENEVFLYLWETEDGRFVAFFARAWCRLADPQYYARIDVKEMAFETWGLSEKLDPANNPALRMEDDTLVMPVYNAIRRDPTDSTIYLIAGGITYEEFRKRMVEAEVSS